MLKPKQVDDVIIIQINVNYNCNKYTEGGVSI